MGVSDLQVCRLLTWKWAVRGKGLKTVQWCIRNSVMLFNTTKSVSERPQTYLLKRKETEVIAGYVRKDSP